MNKLLTDSRFILAPSIGRYYAQAVLIPSVLIVIGDIVLGAIDAEKNKNYKSEWLNEEGVLQVMAVMALLHIGLVCVLSFTMFFNEKEKVRKNAALRALTWFLVPMGWLSYLLGSVLLDGFRGQFTDEHFWVFLNTMPYAVGFVIAYIGFGKELKRIVSLTAE